MDSEKEITLLKQTFTYCESGNLYRILRYGRPCSPYIPYTATNNSGYFSLRVPLRGKVSLHVAIWAICNGRYPPANMEVDHVNRNKLDNRIENLRLVSKTQNKLNVGIRSTNTSGTSNVCFHKPSGLWRVCLKVNGKVVTKYFASEHEAVCQRDSLFKCLSKDHINFVPYKVETTSLKEYA